MKAWDALFWTDWFSKQPDLSRSGAMRCRFRADGGSAPRRDRRDRCRDQVHRRSRHGRTERAVGGAVASYLHRRSAPSGQFRAGWGGRTHRNALQPACTALPGHGDAAGRCALERVRSALARADCAGRTRPGLSGHGYPVSGGPRRAPSCQGLTAAMIFIPCRDGASHVEHEWAEPAHVMAGASVLAQVVYGLTFAGQLFAAER